MGIAYIAMIKIRYIVMRFKDTLSVDEAEVLLEDLILLVEDIMYYMIQKSWQKNIQLHGIILGLILVNFKAIQLFPLYLYFYLLMICSFFCF
jgi:hypothetical protein